MEIFSQRIRILRLEKGLKQSDIANSINISMQSYSAYENGREPNFELLCQISSFFNVSADYLLGKSSFRNLSDVKLLNIDLDNLSDAKKNEIAYTLKTLVACANMYENTADYAMQDYFDFLIGDLNKIIDAYSDVVFANNRYSDTATKVKNFLDKLLHINYPNVIDKMYRSEQTLKDDAIETKINPDGDPK